MKTNLKLIAGLIGAATIAGVAMAQPADAPKKEAQPAEKPKQEEKIELVYILLKTTRGDVLVELNQTKAPISAANFVKYVEKGHYDGTIFHRTIPGFMIQGGGMTKNMSEKPTDSPIKNEWQNGLKNQRGTLAMARTNAPDSATSQFFINVANNDFLDQPRGGAAYAVFGKVVAGMGVVDAIVAAPTKPNAAGENSEPVSPVTLEKATKLTKEQADEIINKPADKPAEAPKTEKPADKK